MAKKNVEALLIAGGGNASVRHTYDAIKTKEEFVAKAIAEGYDFTVAEFEAVLNEAGDSFDLIGNPAKRMIWWK